MIVAADVVRLDVVVVNDAVVVDNVVVVMNIDVGVADYDYHDHDDLKTFSEETDAEVKEMVKR